MLPCWSTVSAIICSRELQNIVERNWLSKRPLGGPKPQTSSGFGGGEGGGEGGRCASKLEASLEFGWQTNVKKKQKNEEYKQIGKMKN